MSFLVCLPALGSLDRQEKILPSTDWLKNFNDFSHFYRVYSSGQVE